MELDDVVRSCAADGQLVHLAREPARPARGGELRRPLPPSIADRIPPAGLWSHQAAALNLVRDRRSVALASGTASGKSLVFQLAIGEAVAASAATALVLYPTKALAQDQLRSWGALDLPKVTVATYDGDCDAEHRAWTRRHANVVLSNPDMLHAGILPFHGRWSEFLHRLHYVVLDELHTLRGIYGTHTAHLMRRLRRLCAAYGSAPTFVCCSATIGHAGALASAITGVEVDEITDDGSPRGERSIALWNPGRGDNGDGRRVSAHAETARLLARLVAADRRTIAFTRSRRGAEVVAAIARGELQDAGRPDLAAAVRSYRGGYLADERREIEAALFGGQVKGIAATNALELGIDVGGLDACILDGFPGTFASLWQQAGRAGRSQQHSLAILVAGEDALDQWLMAHPQELFLRSPEAAVVNPGNPFVLQPHLECAAYEQPLSPDDAALWDDGDLDDAVLAGVQADRLAIRNGRAVYAGWDQPARSVGLRTGSSHEYRIVDEEARLIGTVDESRAFESVHPGAIYLHQGEHYRVDRLDIDDRAAWVVPADGAEWTQSRRVVDIAIVGEDEAMPIGTVRLSLGSVEVTQQVVGYQRRDAATGDVLGTEALELPATSLRTRAFWYTVPDSVAAAIAPRHLPGALHAAEHAAIGILPLFTICDRWDVGGVSTAIQAQTGRATIFIYDGYPGGAGIAELGFGAQIGLLSATLDVVASCPCESGCPSCVQSPKCGNLNEPLHKRAAITLLKTILTG